MRDTPEECMKAGKPEEPYQGFAGAVGVLLKVFHDRVVQEVQAIYKDCGGSHALHHQQHYPIPAWNVSGVQPHEHRVCKNV